MRVSTILSEALIGKKPNILKRLRILVDRIDENDKVLDIGCGVGSYITDILGYLPVKVTAIDYDKKSIEYAIEHNGHKNIEYIVALGESYMPDEKFDIVICSHVIEHSPEPLKLLENIHKLLEVNGILYLALPNGYGCFEIENIIPKMLSLTEYGKKFIGSIISKSVRDSLNYDSPHIQYFTMGKLKTLLKDAYFSIEKIYREQIIGGAFTDRTLLRSRLIADLNLCVAERLPYFMANGWILICKKT